MFYKLIIITEAKHMYFFATIGTYSGHKFLSDKGVLVRRKWWQLHAEIPTVYGTKTTIGYIRKQQENWRPPRPRRMYVAV